MSSQQEPGRPLPKFGEWDVNNPSSTEFSVIFARARDDKKGNGAPCKGAPPPPPQKHDSTSKQSNNYRNPSKKKRGCCCCF